MVREGKPDIVVMDIRLKGERAGIDAAFEIGSFSSAPIAWLTGNDQLLSPAVIEATLPSRIWTKPPASKDLKAMLAFGREEAAATRWV